MYSCCVKLCVCWPPWIENETMNDSIKNPKENQTSKASNCSKRLFTRSDAVVVVSMTENTTKISQEHHSFVLLLLVSIVDSSLVLLVAVVILIFFVVTYWLRIKLRLLDHGSNVSESTDDVNDDDDWSGRVSRWFEFTAAANALDNGSRSVTNARDNGSRSTWEVRFESGSTKADDVIVVLAADGVVVFVTYNQIDAWLSFFRISKTKKKKVNAPQRHRVDVNHFLLDF